MEFKDHFSGHAVDYARYRPDYPVEMLEFLAECAPGRQVVWDCATGNGQAASQMASFFDRVIASDASAQQLSSAPIRANVFYLRSLAEVTPFPARSIDAVTVAQALHWFDLDRFYREVRRVARRGALLAVWTYSQLQGGAEIQPLLDEFFHRKVGAYWPPERRHVDAGYATLPFPFARLEAPSFEIEIQADLRWFLGYLRTWSATRRYLSDRGLDPVTEYTPAFETAWGSSEVKTFRWKLPLLAGHV